MAEQEFDFIIPTPEDNQKASRLPDIRDQVSDIIPYLQPAEKVVYVKNYLAKAKAKKLSSLREIYRLLGTEYHGQIGETGPIKASAALHEDEPEKAFHKFEALFGRDSLRVAIDLADRYPKLARATLVRLAELQGVVNNIAREEEPGKIIHEERDTKTDPIAQELERDDGWGWPYYGAVDTTPEFIRTLLAYCKVENSTTILHEHYTGRDGTEHSMAEALVGAVNWILAKIDQNPEGLLEFKRINPNGLINQAWKDSFDSYHHADGSLANHRAGIASVEVQRVAFDALLDAAELYEDALGLREQAAILRQKGEQLRQDIFEYFWTDKKGGYFVLGTDRDSKGNLRQLNVRTSNMGHLLHSRLLVGEDPAMVAKREAIIRQIFSPQMLNISGVRTLASDEVLFRPGAYHNGSVWLWDTYFISKGLEHHGYFALADDLRQRIMGVVNTTGQFPEYARGDEAKQPGLNTREIDVYDGQNKRINRIEQPPQEIQAWSVAAILAVKIKHSKGVLKEADDPAKRAFELEILGSLTT